MKKDNRMLTKEFVNEFFEEAQFEAAVDSASVEVKPTKQYIAVKGISLDKFKARFRSGDKIPLEYLQELPADEFEHLLSKRAIKEVGSE